MGFRPCCSAFMRDEARLRHRAFDRVDEQQHAVDHAEHALDLAAEVGVAGRVDDVDVMPVVVDRAVLGEDRDAALALEVVAVHHPLGDVLVLGKRAGLDQELVDQRGLAVVDVGDDGDVAEVAARCRAVSCDPKVGPRRAAKNPRLYDARAGPHQQNFEKRIT